MVQKADVYIDKMIKILEDKTKFECIEGDLTIQREERLTSYLKNLVDQNKMDVQTYNQIRPVGS